MNKGDVQAVLARVLTWPPEAQQEAVATLRAIECEWLDDAEYRPTPGELEDADRSGVARDDEVEFRSFRAV